MRRPGIPFLALAFLALSVLPSGAQETGLPAPAGFVNDTAGTMGDWAEKTEALCREIERSTGAEVAVLTVKTTGGIGVQEYAQRAFDRWGVGKKGKDNGVLILVAVDDRKMWIATGYGVEGFLPDGKVGEIRDRAMLPLFREGKYGEGIHAGVSRLGDALRQAGTSRDGGPARESSPPSLFLLILALLLVLFLFQILSAGGGGAAGRRYRRDDGGFGGGGGGGGGAGGGW